MDLRNYRFWRNDNKEMVAFCSKCNHSLPFADVHIVDGEEVPEVDYECPHCDEPSGERADTLGEQVEASTDILLRNGKEL